MIFILFLFASWLAGSMMNFQFGAGEGGSWDISFIGPFVTILIFAVPVFIFWRARTRIFFLIFSVALFWIITPVFFQALTALIVGFTIIGIVLTGVVFKKGYISKKMAALLMGTMGGIGGGIFYLIAISGDNGGAVRPGEGILPWEEIFEGYVGPGIFILISIAVFGIGFFLYQKYELYEIFKMKDKDDKKKIEKDVSSAVDKAIRDLLEGKDIESTIMECYNQMALILEERGIRDEKHMTPREFEKNAIENLDVKTSKISRIREIFELAKYSSHRLEEKDKERVIEDLEALRDELT